MSSPTQTGKFSDTGRQTLALTDTDTDTDTTGHSADPTRHEQKHNHGAARQARAVTRCADSLLLCCSATNDIFRHVRRASRDRQSYSADTSRLPGTGQGNDRTLEVAGGPMIMHGRTHATSSHETDRDTVAIACSEWWRAEDMRHRASNSLNRANTSTTNDQPPLLPSTKNPSV